MYKPKKQWQMYEKLMRKNLVPDEDGNVEYRLGEEQWEKDIVRIAKLKKLDGYEVATSFNYSGFIRTYISGEISGEADYLKDYYVLLWETRGENSFSYDYWKIFNKNISGSKYWKLIEESRIRFAKENGIEIRCIEAGDWSSGFGEGVFVEEKW